MQKWKQILRSLKKKILGSAPINNLFAARALQRKADLVVNRGLYEYYPKTKTFLYCFLAWDIAGNSIEKWEFLTIS